MEQKQEQDRCKEQVERLVGITEILLTNDQEKIFAQLGRMPVMSGKART